MSTITSANSVFTMVVGALYPIPVQMQGYAADDAFASEEVEFMEKYMGIDGKLSAGYIPYIIPFDFTLQADSASNLIMEQIVATEKSIREKLVLSVNIALPSTGLLYSFTNGYLDKGPVMPSAKKTLTPRKWSLAFQDMSPSPILL